MPLETDVTLKNVAVAFCDRCNVEQDLVTGFLLLPLLKRHSVSLREAGWEERDEGYVCPPCLAEDKEIGSEEEDVVGIAAIAELVGAKKKPEKKTRKKKE